jgi:hypothetical protein
MDSFNFSGFFKNSLVYGGPIGEIGCPSLPISELLQPIDFTSFITKDKSRISTEAVELYQKGWSLREIAKELGASKSGIGSMLLKAGIKLRDKVSKATNQRGVSTGKQSVQPCFGFCYFEGQIIKDPREFPTLRLIHRRWNEKRTIHEIGVELNNAKVPSRTGTQWSWAALKKIINRFETKKLILTNRGSYEFR